MAKKLNSMPDYTAHLPKHPHDVSQSFAFTACPGMLLPVYYDMLHLGDELHFSASEFVRFNPLEQQTLCDIDVHLDYFFVPLTVMYLPSSSLFYQTDDLVSSLFSSNSGQDLKKTSFPVFNFTAYLGELNSNLELCCMSDCALTNTYQLNEECFDCYGMSIYRLWDFLDMSPDILVQPNSQASELTNYPNYTPWFALAYQAIYQLYFRNDDREPKNYHYNIDFAYKTGTFVEDPTSASSVKSIFNINYASRPKDYFNSVKVSPISSSTSLLNSNALNVMYRTVNEWINNTSMNLVERASQSSNLEQATQLKANNGYVTTSNVRNLFMVEKLLRVIGRAEKNYESQFLAHYGIKIPHDVMHNITHIGHDMITIKPEAVISSANTWNSTTGDGSALGEIGGKGSGMLTGRKFNFTAPFHGVFMAISHIVPRIRYISGLSKLHDLNSPNKFWQPEFDQKGMQPLFKYEFAFHQQPDMTARYGWQFAYEQFKRKYDRASHCFVPSRVYAEPTVNTYSPWVLANYAFSALNHSGSSFIYNPSELMPPALLVTPNDLNVAMQVPHQTAWSGDFISSPWLIYQTDPFICDFNMYCKKVNRMSEYGEPEL